MRRWTQLLDDRLIGAVGALLGVTLLAVTPYAVRTATALIPGTDILFIRGDFYPRVTAGLLIVTGLWLLASDWLRAARGRPAEPWPGRALTLPEFLWSFAFLLGVAAYVYLIIEVGFAIGCAIAFVVLGRLLGGKLPWTIVMAIILTLAMEVVFGLLFRIPLPGRLFA